MANQNETLPQRKHTKIYVFVIQYGTIQDKQTTHNINMTTIHIPQLGLTYSKHWYIRNGRVYDAVENVVPAQVPANEPPISYKYAELNGVYDNHKKALTNSSQEFFHHTLRISSIKMYDFAIKYIVPDSPTKQNTKNREVVRIFSHKVVQDEDATEMQISYERLLED